MDRGEQFKAARRSEAVDEVDRVATELAGRVKLVKVNVDESPKLTERLTVQAVPTLLVLNNGQVVARQAGAAPAAALRTWVEEPWVRGS